MTAMPLPRAPLRPRLSLAANAPTRAWRALTTVVTSLAIALICGSAPTAAQPAAGSTVRDRLALGWGASVALPEGDWKVTATTTLPRKGHAWEAIVLRHAREDAKIPLLVIRHTRDNVSWGPLPCHSGPRPEGSLWFMGNTHESAANSTINLCSRVWSIGDYDQWRTRVVPGNAWWKELTGLELDGAQSAGGLLLVEMMLQEHQRRGIRVEAFVRPPQGRTPAQFRDAVLAGQGGTEADMLSTWVSVYVASTQLSFLSLTPRPIVALGYPTGTAAAPAATVVASSPRPAPATATPGVSAGNAAAAPARVNAGPPASGAAPSATATASTVATAAGAAIASSPAPAKAATGATSTSSPGGAVAGAAVALEQQNRELQRQLDQMRQALVQLQVAAASARPAAPEPAPADRPFTPRPPAPHRKALVIGNDRYTDVPPLANAVADAEAMARTLQAVGFTVTRHVNLTEKRFKQALRDFRMQVQGGDEVIVYYAGHGVQLGAANYLLPVDIRADHEEQVKDEAIALQRILDDLNERKAKFSLAVIDACRDNPFQSKGRSIGGRGLAPTSAATGQMVMYSAGAGQQALDRLGPNDPERNGLFTRVLLREMTRPGQSVDRVLRSVRNEVVRLARSVGHEQTPALYDQAIGEFFFAP